MLRADGEVAKGSRAPSFEEDAELKEEGGGEGRSEGWGRERPSILLICSLEASGSIVDL